MSEENQSRSIEQSAPPPASVWYSLPTPLKEVLGYAGIAYAMGFLTIMINTARYGVQALEMMKAINVWVGVVPTLLLSAFFIFWKKFIAPEVTADDREFRKAFVEVMIPVLMWAVLHAIRPTIGLVHFIPPAKTLGHPYVMRFLRMQDAALQWLYRWFPLALVIMGLILAVYFITTYRHPKSWPLRVKRGVLMIASTSVFIMYVEWLYPRLPQEYGFGQPTPVRFVLEAKNSSIVRPDRSAIGQDQTASVKKGAEENQSAIVTPDLELLFRTEKEYIVRCNTCPVPIISISAEAVKAIWYMKRSR